jgi:hypothetical protein
MNLFKLKTRVCAVAILSAMCIHGQSASDQSPQDPLAQRPAEIAEREPGRTMLPYELTRATEKLVSPTREEKRRFEVERRAGGYKLLKIFSAPRCASERLVVDVSSAECTASIDYIRASFYSFRYGVYGETVMDVRVLEDTMTAGNGGMVHGMVIDLGAVDSSGYDAKHPDVRALADFPVAQSIEEEESQRGRLAEGVEVGGRLAEISKTLKPEHVYLVRVVAYGYKRDDRANFFRGINRAIFFRDQVYVMKYGGINKDGVAMFLWKKVSDKASPKL